MANYLGIEIGGTKLQLGIGDGSTNTLTALERHDIDVAEGAQGILAKITSIASSLIQQYEPVAVGIGFGGPVDSVSGVVTTSHQVAGWDAFPLAHWIQDRLGLRVTIGNDCDCAALAESRFGAGAGRRSMAYVTVGTGIGGGLIIDGRLQGEGRPAVAEIGHLRPSPNASDSACTIESIASGWGIAAVARNIANHCLDQTVVTEELSSWNRWLFQLADQVLRGNFESETQRSEARVPWQAHPESGICAWHNDAKRWKEKFGSLDELTAKDVADAAAENHPIAVFALQLATRVLGWGLAQVITITAVECIVVGGGVSLMDERLFLTPLRAATNDFVFRPMSGQYEISLAALGEEVVVHGAISLVAESL